MEALGNIAADMEFGASASTPFASMAPEMANRYGLPVIPLRGKRAIHKGWQTFDCTPSQVANWAEKHPDANVGIVTGERSGLVVVDVDDPDRLADVIDHCGDTPLTVSTPGGGFHLYFRHTGERNHCGIVPKVDVRGTGGLIAAPPSVRLDDDGTPRLYAFETGDWIDLADVPPIRKDGLQSLHGEQEAALPKPNRSYEVGVRNNTLWRACMRQAPHCEDEDQLHAFAAAFNSESSEPLDPAEVKKTATSAWGYEERGENWIGGRFQKQKEIRMALYCQNPDAALLHTFLTDYHAGRQQPFAASPKAMAEHGLIHRWSHGRYRAALQTLVEKGLLVRTHKGGSKPGDPAKYDWPQHV